MSTQLHDHKWQSFAQVLGYSNERAMLAALHRTMTRNEMGELFGYWGWSAERRMKKVGVPVVRHRHYKNKGKKNPNMKRAYCRVHKKEYGVNSKCAYCCLSHTEQLV